MIVGIVGLCECLYADSGAMLLTGIWWQENRNKLVEWKALVDTVSIKSANLKDCGFPNCLDIGKGHKLPYAAWND